MEPLCTSGPSHYCLPFPFLILLSPFSLSLSLQPHSSGLPICSPLSLLSLSTITLPSSRVSFPPVSLCSPRLPFPSSLSTSSHFTLTVCSPPHHFTLFIPKLLTSHTPSFIFSHPSCSSCSYPSPPPSHPSAPLLLFCCVSCSPGVWLNKASVLEKCPKIRPVVGDIIESGMAFPTKCHRRHASPRYRAEQIDHLYDAQWHSHNPHTQPTNVWVCIPSCGPLFCCFTCTNCYRSSNGKLHEGLTCNSKY